MKWLSNTCLILLCTFLAAGLQAQDPDVPMDHITLDSFTVTAVRQGLDIRDLIELMQFDSTLYMAFNNLHFTAYAYDLSLNAYDKRGRLEAWKRERVRQTRDGQCREQFIDSSAVEGDFKTRRGKDRYYTAELFNRTFHTPGRVCGERRKTDYRDVVHGSREEGHLGAIKRVIFNPGSPVDLPLIGKKFGLFKPYMIEYYDYAISSVTYAGTECYEFNITVKPEFAGHPRDVIVRTLTTLFNKEDFQVLRRGYHLYYNGALVRCDIRMDIALQRNGDRYYPDHFSYDGEWNVPAKKPENIDLTTDFSYGAN